MPAGLLLLLAVNQHSSTDLVLGIMAAAATCSLKDRLRRRGHKDWLLKILREIRIFFSFFSFSLKLNHKCRSPKSISWMVLTWGESRGEHLKLDVLAPPLSLTKPLRMSPKWKWGGAEMHVRTDGRTDGRACVTAVKSGAAVEKRRYIYAHNYSCVRVRRVCSDARQQVDR